MQSRKASHYKATYEHLPKGLIAMNPAKSMLPLDSHCLDFTYSRPPLRNFLMEVVL